MDTDDQIEWSVIKSDMDCINCIEMLRCIRKSCECKYHLKVSKANFFLLVDLREFFSDLGSGGRKKKSSKNDQLTGHFQRVFLYIFR